ncbi:hypothetical protein F5Y15DRAFT_36179 [Xylariaceae sp. FL0016]|nr:hypothetical protein F5Y15DRAFT_36179 [Xylariaceae sp. FL0016]
MRPPLPPSCNFSTRPRKTSEFKATHISPRPHSLSSPRSRPPSDLCSIYNYNITVFFSSTSLPFSPCTTPRHRTALHRAVTMSTIRAALWRRELSSLANPAPIPSILPRASRSLPRNAPRPRPRRPHQRFQSTKPDARPPQPNPDSQTTTTRHQTRLSSLLSRLRRFLPSRLHASLSALRSAPLSHILSFLLLHELTAVLPLFGLTYAFHRLEIVPTAWVAGPWAAWAEEGLRTYAGYFRKKGWFGLSKDGADGSQDLNEGEARLEQEVREDAMREREREEKEGRRGWFGMLGRKEKESTAVEEGGASGAGGMADAKDGKGKAKAAWQTVKKVVTVDNTDKGYKIGIQIAAAYTITKLLLVPRVALSLWLTPWMARGLVRFRRSIFSKRS